MDSDRKTVYFACFCVPVAAISVYLQLRSCLKANPQASFKVCLILTGLWKAFIQQTMSAGHTRAKSQLSETNHNV